MMVNEKEHVINDDIFTNEDIRYLKVAIALAIGSPDIYEMPKTKTSLELLSEKADRMYLKETNRGKA